MSDILRRFFIENLHIRGEWVSLKSSWDEIQKTAAYPEPIRNVLGEALVAITLLAESLKFEGSLVLQIRGTSPVTMLVVQATSDGAIRGIARWQGEIESDSSFNDLFGAGTMVISVENKPKAGAQQGERYQSLVSLKGESLSECFADYFAQSEQLNTSLYLAADKERAAGILLQSLPSDNNKTTGDDTDWDHATLLAQTLNSDSGKKELLSLDAEQLLHRLYHEEDLILYDGSPIRFECSCSQEKIESTVFSLGKNEAKGILEEQGAISIDCEFCNTHYELDSVDIERIFNDSLTISKTDGQGSVH